MTDSDNSEHYPEIDNLNNMIEKLTLNDNFINLKPTVKEEISWNPNITDIPSTSRETNKIAYNKNPRSYAGVHSVTKNTETHGPLKDLNNEPIHPFGVYLDLDCITNGEEVIDKWETALRIAVTVNKLDYDTTIGFIERSLVNSALRFWRNMTNEVRDVIYKTDDNISNLVTRAVEIIRLEFLGEGNILKDPKTIKKYTIALLRLQLCDMCEIDRYICVFQDYYYHIYNQVSGNDYLSLFFAKIPDPWGQKLIDTYNPGASDTLGKRITHLKDKLSEWCGDAILKKLTKGLRKRITLCCDNPKMPLMIGCDGQYYYQKIKRKYKKRKHFRKKYFKRRTARYYKKKGFKKPFKPSFKRKKEKNPKDCKCYYCHEMGHYANSCPKKFKNTKIFEIDEDIEEMINQGEFVKINEFQEINSDSSIYIITDTEYETTDSENE